MSNNNDNNGNRKFIVKLGLAPDGGKLLLAKILTTSESILEATSQIFDGNQNLTRHGLINK